MLHKSLANTLSRFNAQLAPRTLRVIIRTFFSHKVNTHTRHSLVAWSASAQRAYYTCCCWSLGVSCFHQHNKLAELVECYSNCWPPQAHRCASSPYCPSPQSSHLRRALLPYTDNYMWLAANSQRGIKLNYMLQFLLLLFISLICFFICGVFLELLLFYV